MSDARQGQAVADEPDENRARKNGLYGEVSSELAENMRQGWADTERHDLAPVAQAAYTAHRRAALSARFPGELLVVPAGNPKVRANDTNYPFRPSSDYVHLTGDQSQDSVLVLEPGPGGEHRAIAYLLPRSDRENGEFWRDYHGELWDGRRNSLTENERLLGLPCRDVRTLTERLATASGPVRLLRGYDAGVDAALHDRVTAEHDAEFRATLSELRLIKDAFEIADLREACRATVRGFEDVVRALGTDTPTPERVVEGTFWMRARIEGNDVGYASVCAAGPHATTLHWGRNDGEARPGELLLIDAGVESRNLYTADVTRTLPVDGRFTPVQRRVYDAVYAAQSAGVAAVRPGAKYRDFHHSAQRMLAEHLASWGLFGGRSVDEAYGLGLHRRWTLAGTGHMLGLDVHDCAKARTELYVDGTLAAGMVLTVEPGLYFQPDDLTVPEELRGIGVRIEDDFLVTEDGSENLSAGLPRAADEVEAWMARLRG
ncbi:aminopeptidase P family protein [Streptomyces fimicarius]|uniref:Xaa-Pro aminopeptidase n=1 Tax=Streptomyces caviscabies TaxID=90079 RepID=A0ABW2MB26_9ACTN|nr:MULTISPECIES: aminopeptidase P family protein [Streptomyces]MDX3502102.1 aminopeptidase P family protein [Streptomyces sp. ATCC51928]MDX5522778.1 aminopeptidase P family protein [Streptomyces sp. DE06-01C]